MQRVLIHLGWTTPPLLCSLCHDCLTLFLVSCFVFFVLVSCSMFLLLPCTVRILVYVPMRMPMLVIYCRYKKLRVNLLHLGVVLLGLAWRLAHSLAELK